MLIKNIPTEFGVDVTVSKVIGMSIDSVAKTAEIIIAGYIDLSSNAPIKKYRVSVSNYEAIETRHIIEEDGNEYDLTEPVPHNDFDAFESLLGIGSWVSACESYLKTQPTFDGALIS